VTPVPAASTSLASCLSGLAQAGCFTSARVGTRDLSVTPFGLSSTVNGDSVRLSWSAPPTADRVLAYVIQAGGSPAGTDLASIQVDAGTTTFSAAGVPTGAYYVRVLAVTSHGVTLPSNEVLVVVGAFACSAAPSTPTALGAYVLGPDLFIGWTASQGQPTAYVLEAGSSSGLSNVANNELPGPGTRYAAFGVPAGTYYLRIRARNACGTSAASNEVSASVGGTPTVNILAVGGDFNITPFSGQLALNGSLDVTVDQPVFGRVRAVLGGLFEASAQFPVPTQQLRFAVFQALTNCPPLSGTTTLTLLGADGRVLTTLAVTLTGSGCVSGS